MDWVAVISTLIGSAGLSVLVTSLATLSKAHRLRRSIDSALDLAGKLPEGASPRRHLIRAAEESALLLAAMTLSRRAPWYLVAIYSE